MACLLLPFYFRLTLEGGDTCFENQESEEKL